MTLLTFLDLPLSVRQRIYSYAGCKRPWCPIEILPRSNPRNWKKDHAIQQAAEPTGDQEKCYFINRRLIFESIIGEEWLGGDCFCPSICVALFQVSKAVYREVCEVFYGQHVFVLRAHSPQDLKPILALGNTALAALRKVIIRLNCWPCPNGHERRSPYNPDGLCFRCRSKDTSADPLLTAQTVLGRKMVRKWTAVCSHLRSSITMGQLDLTFISDVEDIRTASLVMEPLLLLPRLSKCTIRLGQPNSELRDLAEHAARKLVGAFEPTTSRTSPWARLPKELRLHILDMTHLGALGDYHDSRRVPLGDNDVHREVPAHNFDGLGSLYNRKSWLPMTPCCHKCTTTYADCCCPSRYAASSASCVCRIYPFELFFVSKQMHEDAAEVFFNQQWCFYEPSPATLFFLKRLPKKFLRMFRQIRFVFDIYFARIFNSEDREGYRDGWQDIITFIRDNFDVPKLSIKIDTKHGSWEWCTESTLEWLPNDRNLWVYKVQRELGAVIMENLLDLRDVIFKFGAYKDLEPLMEKEAMGNRYRERRYSVPAGPDDDGWLEWCFILPSESSCQIAAAEDSISRLMEIPSTVYDTPPRRH